MSVPWALHVILVVQPRAAQGAHLALVFEVSRTTLAPLPCASRKLPSTSLPGSFQSGSSKACASRTRELRPVPGQLGDASTTRVSSVSRSPVSSSRCRGQHTRWDKPEVVVKRVCNSFAQQHPRFRKAGVVILVACHKLCARAAFAHKLEPCRKLLVRRRPQQLNPIGIARDPPTKFPEHVGKRAHTGPVALQSVSSRLQYFLKMRPAMVESCSGPTELHVALQLIRATLGLCSSSNLGKGVLQSQHTHDLHGSAALPAAVSNPSPLICQIIVSHGSH